MLGNQNGIYSFRAQDAARKELGKIKQELPERCIDRLSFLDWQVLFSRRHVFQTVFIMRDVDGLRPSDRQDQQSREPFFLERSWVAKNNP